MLDAVRNSVRSLMRQIARVLNKLSGGHLNPNAVTLIGLLLHLVVGWQIIDGNFTLAGILLVVFGLLDTLDGELARLQQRASSAGMLLDATSDRAKEAILYGAVSYHFAQQGDAHLAAVATLALGASLLVSYSKAKGEAALSERRRDLSPNQLNRLLQDGLMRFELRIGVLALGLVTDQLAIAVYLVLGLSTITAIGRVVMISKVLKRD